MIYIVALGVGFKCPRKIHLNTQCPPTPRSGMYYEVRHSSKIGGWRLKKGKATSEHLHLCYGSKMAIRNIHKYLFKHLRFFKGILDFRCLKKQESKQGDNLFRICHFYMSTKQWNSGISAHVWTDFKDVLNTAPENSRSKRGDARLISLSVS